jgi:hypothetical protein
MSRSMNVRTAFVRKVKVERQIIDTVLDARHGRQTIDEKVRWMDSKHIFKITPMARLHSAPPRTAE